MSAKTKIVVLHMKKIIFAAIAAGILLLGILLLFLTLHSKDSAPEESESVPTLYVPGVYTSSVKLTDASLDIQVVVDENNINSISLVNLDETMETMYPLIRPALDDLSSQIVANQSTDGLTYSKNRQYTSMVLVDAIEDALKKAASE